MNVFKSATLYDEHVFFISDVKCFILLKHDVKNFFQIKFGIVLCYIMHDESVSPTSSLKPKTKKALVYQIIKMLMQPPYGLSLTHS